MVKSVEKISLWTEGLDRNWVSEPHNRERMPRGELAMDQLKPLLDDIRFKNGGDSEGLLILQGAGKRLHITVQDDAILLADPQNPNYQNVSVKEEELEEFIAEYFSLEEAGHEGERTHFRYVYYGLILVGLIALAGTVYFVATRVSFEQGFYPKAVVAEIDNETEFNRLKETFSGIYATGTWDGALVIELTPDLEFTFYDMKRSSPGRFLLEPVMSGDYRPVYEMGSAAILANGHMVLNPVDADKLLFENREYSLLGKSREEVPHLAFPE